MKKALLFLVLLAVSVGLFAQDAPTNTITATMAITGRVIPFQYTSRQYAPTQPPGPDGADTLLDYANVGIIGAAMGRDNTARTTRAEINIQGAHGNIIGIRAQLQLFPDAPVAASINGAQNILFGDNVKLWWRPMPELLIEAGKTAQGTFEGKIGDTFANGYTVGMFGGGNIFSSLSTGGKIGGYTSDSNAGILALYESTSGLKVGLVVPRMGRLNQANRSGDIPSRGDAWSASGGENDFMYTFRKSQIAVGYTIPNIGFARVQFIGSAANPVDSDGKMGAFTFDSNGAIIGYSGNTYAVGDYRAPTIEAAFNLTAVDKLNLDIGGKVPLALKPGMVSQSYRTQLWDEAAAKYTPIYSWMSSFNAEQEDWKIQAPYTIAVGASYTGVANLDIRGRVDALVGGKVEVTKTSNPGSLMKEGESIKMPLLINAHLWPTYTLTDMGNLKVIFDVGVAYLGPTKWDNGDIYAKRNSTGPLDRGNDGKEGGLLFGLGVFIDKAIGPGSFQTGIGFKSAAKVNNYGSALNAAGTAYTTDNNMKEDMTITIPIHFGATF